MPAYEMRISDWSSDVCSSDLLCDGNGRLPADWVGGHLKRIDLTDGDIDTLATRLAHIRPWTYIAHRADSRGGSWLDNSRGWQDRNRAIESSEERRLGDEVFHTVNRRRFALDKKKKNSV